MKKAIEESLLSLEKNEVPVGAVIVYGEKIITKAHNLVESLCDVTAHAEIQAIGSVSYYLGGKYLKGCTLYVTLEPCNMCWGLFIGHRSQRWSLEHMILKMDFPKKNYYFIPRRKLLEVS